MNKTIKWGCIQPLTGGMYIGARNAFGYDAEWIISYPGLCDAKTDKDGNIITAGNEYNLLTWLNKHNYTVPYYTFKHNMFESIQVKDAIISSDNYPTDPNIFDDIDVVVAVPVCSGLSTATSCDLDASVKDARNCNMKWITTYTLYTIHPKVYIFENAPNLMGDRGEATREELQEIANKYGYSIAYYKTDTQFHGVPQRRPRTFIFFFKKRNNEDKNPKLEFVENVTTMKEYLSLIPSNATQQDLVLELPFNKTLVKYAEYKWGADWRNVLLNEYPKKTSVDILMIIIEKKLMNDFLDYADNNYNEVDREERLKQFHRLAGHITDKLDQGKGFWKDTPVYHTKIFPAIMFKTMVSCLHPFENRILTVRECLHLMGMPMDFELQGVYKNNFKKIGQNVPVKTAQYMVEESIRIINDWDNIDRSYGGFNKDMNCAFFDNTKKKINVA